MSKAGNYPIPFDKKGDVMYYPQNTYEWPDGYGLGKTRIEVGPEWRENIPFDDVLTYRTFSRGRSAANLEFTKSDGRVVTMFLTDFDKAATKMVNGQLAGKFMYTKRGQNYGIRLI